MLHDWVRLGSRLVRLLRDHHHPARHEEILQRLLQQARHSVGLREQRRLRVPVSTYPPQLPISARKDEIVSTIRAHQVVVIVGETGSGKTTQIPKMCLEAGLGIEAKVGCTQPRRVAALSISRRIADELGVTWGREVGCQIRFDDRSSPDTFIKVMTDGILLAETQGDPLLSEYNGLIIDEAHERSLNIDFLLGYLKGLLKKRPELKLVITSATIDTEAFSKAFENAPVIEVSGRLYPVEVAYAPLDADSEEVTYIEAAARATEQVLCEPGAGDVLIFMPGERDIRETGDLLKTRFGNDAEIIPLYGRLSSGEQQRVFAESSRRKVIIATNIAETSLTIPGIRFVIDSGLVRISRYNPRTRTKRLPIEPVSQSSANQRKGRSGRLENGFCMRLYSEADFRERPAYTQPEIQRANLAEVILRMKAFRLGEIETFPFLNPPVPNAIQAGYTLLQELGALNASRELTPLGRDLARLPIDPTLGRMLLQAHQEHATRELLIIASGLSIQDPRERPLDQKEAAAAAHKQFADPKSDFLTLLNIWNAVHDQWESLGSQNQRRKFCRANFLSYLRMREWQDLHAQLQSTLEDIGTVYLNESNAAYEAIHRSILTGLLGHVARRVERNQYKGAGNRQLMAFPGSALFDRGEKKTKPAAHQARGQKGPAVAPSQPEWVVAGEIVETSQLFARTLAGIDPLWIIELAPHLCRVTHHDAHWSPEAGRVVVREKTTLYGLELRDRSIAYSTVNPEEATSIFIRSALVEDNLFPEAPTEKRPRNEETLSPSQLLAAARAEKPRLPALYKFLEHNRQVAQKIEVWRTRSRRHDVGDLDEALFSFYTRHIRNVSSLPELNRYLKEHKEVSSLCASEKDLIGEEAFSFDREAFPEQIALGGKPVPLTYAYKPGEERDGVTVRLEFNLAQSISPAMLDWAVPGLRAGQVMELLRALPKSIRRELMPLLPKVEEITRDLQPSGKSLREDLAGFIRERYGIPVSASSWPAEPVPNHLRPRVQIVDHHNQTLATGRDLDQLRQGLEKAQVKPATEPPEWTSLKAKWERFGLTGWTFGDLPEKVQAAGERGAIGWPGLELEDGKVNVRVFASPELARKSTLPGLQRLVELALQKDFAWLQKDLRGAARLEPLTTGWLSAEELQTHSYAHLRRYLLPKEPFSPLSEAEFGKRLEEAKSRLPGLALKLISRLEPVLQLRAELLKRYGPSPVSASAPKRVLSSLEQLAARPVAKPGRPAFLVGSLGSLLPRDLSFPFERWPDIHRYLRALLVRAERAVLNPLKDQEKARKVAPYETAAQKLRESPPEKFEARRLADEFCWMVEEFKVSVFAQELGTAMPVSAKRLDEQRQRIGSTS